MSTVQRTTATAGSITITVRDTAGTLVSPPSAPTVQWFTDTARTTGALTLTVAGSGSAYTASWTAAQAPAAAATRYLKVSIPNAAGGTDVDVDDEITFTASAAGVDELVLTVDEALEQYLDEDTTDPEKRTLAERMIVSATASVERAIGGAILPRTVTETITSTGGPLLLSTYPVLTVTSVTENDVAVSGDGYTLDATAGMVYRHAGFAEIAWAAGRRNIQVVYQAGYSPIPQELKDAVGELFAWRWRQKRVGSRDRDDDFPVGDVSGLPNVVKNLLAGYLRGPSVA